MKKSVLMVLLLSLFVTACGKNPSQTVTEKLRASVEPKVGAFIVEAQRAYERGAYAMALDFTDSVEVYAPELADLHYIRAMVYTAKHIPLIASFAYERVLELDPEYPGANFGLGLSEFRSGRPREAINFYKKELEINESSPAYHELGRSYAKLAVLDSAETAYINAIRIDSANSTAMMWLGQLHEELGDLDTALEWTRKGLDIHPDNLNYQYILGSQLQRSDLLVEIEAIAVKKAG